MSFYNVVYGKVKQIPKGKVATYGQIAALCGSPRASRAVGYALHFNPEPGVIPCHRVVNHAGRLVPGWDEQAELLWREGVELKDACHVDLKRYLWDA